MGIISFCASFLLFTLIFHSCLHYEVASDNPVSRPNRETLEIIIGGGGGDYSPASSSEYPDCRPPPPKPKCRPPPPPPKPKCRPPPPPPKPKCPPPPPPPKPKCPPPPPLKPPSPRPKPPSPPPKPPPPSPTGFESPNIERDYYVIQKFKNTIKAINDPQGITKTWVGNDVCNKYNGFTCDFLPDTKVKTKAIAGVDFNGLGINGPNLSLSGFIDRLPDLAIFHANSIKFTGTVPKGTAKNTRFFYELDLSNNALSGTFPMDVLSATNLTFLDLRFNSLSGSVPPEVFNLNLDVLFINNNKFGGKLPDNLGSTTALYLTFANNRFTGPIPKSIGRAKNLLEVLFLNNQLTGCLPFEIGFLSNATVFDVGFNQLTGPIPYSFGCLAKMELLNLGQNQFYGLVPEIVCMLPNLANLTLSYNYFTQVGPVCRELITKKRLDVTMNCILDLPNQRSKAECVAFFLKPKYCDNLNLMKLVPCKKNWYLNSTERSDQQPMVAAPSPRSYNALIPHR